MSYIHFKSVYNINFDKVAFDGTSISLAQLKKLIAEKQKLSRQIDYDLEITNADTNQVYLNETENILKNSRVLVKRVVKNSTAPLRPQAPKVTQPAPVNTTPVNTPTLAPAPTPVQQAPMVQPTPAPIVTATKPVAPAVITKPVYDSLAPLHIPSKPIVYVEETTKTVAETESDNRMDEKAKLESILINSMTKITPEQIYTNKFLGINRPTIKPQQQINLVDRPIPPGYLCVICRKPGHFKQHCPEAGTLPRPEDRPKFPSGIPRTNLRPAQAGDKFAMLGPEGYVVTEIDQKAAKIVKKDKILFDDEEGEPKKQEKINIQEHTDQIPKDLRCPLGGHLIKDAVLVPCCGHFVCCDECIKQKILKEEAIECPYEKCDQEIGPLASITPFHEIRKKVQEYLKNSKNETKDAFLDLILDDVNNKELNSNLLINKLSPNGPKSPVQDSKITSSEKALAEQLQVNTALNSNSPKTDDQKFNLSPGQIVSAPSKPPTFAPPAQFQPRPRPNFNPNFNQNFRPNIVPLTNNFHQNQPPRPMMPMQQQNFNPMYRPPFQPQYDPMSVPMGLPMGPMGGPMPGQMMPSLNQGFMPNMPPGMMPGQIPPVNMYQQQMPMPGIVQQNNAQIQGILTKDEYYTYQEKLRKEAELKTRPPYKRSRSRSRGRYSRSRSRSPGRYKSNRHRKSRSRSRSRNMSRERSREKNYRRHSRSRSRSRRKSKSRSRDRTKRNSKSRNVRASSRDSKTRPARGSSRDKKLDKREGLKLKSIEENVVVTIGKSNERQVNTVDEPVDKKKKLDSERKTKEVKEVKDISEASSSSDKESGKESSGSGSKKHKHKHKKSKKKHKRRSSSKH